MTRIILDAATLAKLHQLAEPLEVCDEAGNVLGRFTPSLIPPGWEPVTPDISEEELDRRAKSPGKWYTTEEVLEHLRKLEGS
jgi:hypothetical protein